MMKTIIKKYVLVLSLAPAVLFAWTTSAYACEGGGSSAEVCQRQCSVNYQPGTALYVGCMLGTSRH